MAISVVLNSSLLIKSVIVTVILCVSKTAALSLNHHSSRQSASPVHLQADDHDYDNDFDCQFSRRRFAISALAASSSLLLPGTSTVTPCHAVAGTQLQSQTEELKRIYDSQASTYEALYSESIISKKLDFDTLRQTLLSKARGNVLELGVGTGLNLPHYPNNNSITSYTAIDLSPKMLEQAKLRFERATADSGDGRAVSQSLKNLYAQNKVTFQIANVEELASIGFQEQSNIQDSDNGINNKMMKFDTIIDTFGLCVFPNPKIVLSQAKELLSPNNGQLLLLEHQDSIVAKVLSPTRKLSDVSNTCRYDDDVRQLVRDAGFQDVKFVDLASGFLVSVVATNS